MHTHNPESVSFCLIHFYFVFSKLKPDMGVCEDLFVLYPVIRNILTPWTYYSNLELRICLKCEIYFRTFHREIYKMMVVLSSHNFDSNFG